MKTDRFYLEMIVFGSINPIIVMPTLVFTENAHVALAIGTLIGCIQYVWMRKNINKNMKTYIKYCTCNDCHPKPISETEEECVNCGKEIKPS